MQTNFSPEALTDPDVSASNAILRKCVHCGFCTSTCPTFALLGDELDSRRGRIYLIKQMLENERPADRETVKHVDRCLSCLSCMTTCPSGVDYMHLIDHAREHIEKTYRRPFADRFVRGLLAFVLVRPRLFRFSLIGARLVRPIKGLLPPRFTAMLWVAPSSIPRASERIRPGMYRAAGTRRMRVALLQGCVQDVLDPQINQATVEVLNRHGVDVVIPSAVGCCGVSQACKKRH